jgi:hypothetical protein
VRVCEIPLRGRGVIATKKHRCGEVVEVSPVIEVPFKDVRGILHHYTYAFGKKQAIALGFGSLFNHSAHPTLSVSRDHKARIIVFRARRAIARGEELTIDYGYEPRGYDGR